MSRARTALPLLIAAGCLGGCYVSSSYHHHEVDQSYEAEFDVVVASTGESLDLDAAWCTCDDRLELVLELHNRGPEDDAYLPIGSDHTHRFLVYDEFGHLVWDSRDVPHDHTTSAINLPAGATLTMTETWGLVDSFGVPVDPGLYEIEARFSGDLDYGGEPVDPPTITVEVVAVHGG